jgi:hypothetical protein
LGFFVVSGVDNVLRPYLISRGSNLPLILMFFGVLGGLMAFGFLGVFLGPTLLAIRLCSVPGVEWRTVDRQERGALRGASAFGPTQCC